MMIAVFIITYHIFFLKFSLLLFFDFLVSHLFESPSLSDTLTGISSSTQPLTTGELQDHVQMDYNFIFKTVPPPTRSSKFQKMSQTCSHSWHFLLPHSHIQPISVLPISTPRVISTSPLLWSRSMTVTDFSPGHLQLLPKWLLLPFLPSSIHWAALWKCKRDPITLFKVI